MHVKHSDSVKLNSFKISSIIDIYWHQVELGRFSFCKESDTQLSNSECILYNVILNLVLDEIRLNFTLGPCRAEEVCHSPRIVCTSTTLIVLSKRLPL